jgi:phospholipid/cholesterol/gamma-HCH transport system ATP-binding protein
MSGTPASDGTGLAIRVRGLVTRIGGKTVHDHLDLDVKRGEIMAVVGGSGSGKSILMRVLIGLLRPVSGSVSVFDEDIEKLDDKAMQALRRRWGVLFQEGALFSTLTVAENIQLPMRELMPMPQQLMDEIAAIKLALVGLPADTGLKFPSELSGGMKKRAGLARALALDPEVVFLDEPSSGLDPISANQFDELIVNLQRTLNLTVLMVTHDIDSLRATDARVAMLVNKKLTVGTIAELAGNPEPWIHEYFGGIRGRATLAPDRKEQGAEQSPPES